MAKSSFRTAFRMLFEISNLKFAIALWGGRGVVSDQVGLGLEGA
jgi:hypothetical protein